MLARNDLADYIADTYGHCDRETDCYWGMDAHGNRNGCLYVGWRGRACKHWHPVEARSWEELHAWLKSNA